VIPLRDINPSRSFPLVTISIIIVCVLVFLYQVLLGPYNFVFVHQWGVIPYEITHGTDIPPYAPVSPYLKLITYQYLHGSFFHIFGNMLFLWVFGDNVEDKLGKLNFLLFYTLCGIFAGLLQVIFYPDSKVPLIGASGSISGVLGAYMVFFPRARIVSLVFLVFWITIIELPAVFWIGFWFFAQAFNALVSIGHPGAGGIAWFAHVGGFLAGFFIARSFKKEREAVL